MGILGTCKVRWKFEGIKRNPRDSVIVLVRMCHWSNLDYITCFAGNCM